MFVTSYSLYKFFWKAVAIGNFQINFLQYFSCYFPLTDLFHEILSHKSISRFLTL